ncbi:MAG TPA: porin [Candidatus Ratteibacteria bacterium]|nr:porin [bacterium]HPC28858.1 porin [bacterium]HRS06365.1 porin [Candidatus Ratteibacteria bacterium]HRV04639.1 porin [Candidatus Ratteibacteria bacterium]
MEKSKRILRWLAGKSRLFIMTSMFLFGLFAFPLPQAQASKEEMYVILNMLVEKGYITQDESKEILSAIDNIDKKQKEDTSKNIVKASVAENLNISGYIQGRYNAYEFSGTTDEFTTKRAVIGLSGKVVDNVLFKAEIDTAKDNKLLNDAWIKLTYLPKANITVGQFKIPYSEEYLTSSSAIDTIERSLPVDSMATEFDRGIMVDANLFEKRFYYGVALVNGTGKNTSDDNSSKDVIGRVVLTPFANEKDSALSGLKFGLNYQTGTQNKYTNRTRSYDRTRYGALVKYEIKNFKIQTEYLKQDYNHNPDATKPDAEIESNGWYALMTYTFPMRNGMNIQPVLKYETYDPDNNVETNTQSITTFGVNWNINKATKFSTNYRWRNDDRGGKTATNMNEWFSQLQIKF